MTTGCAACSDTASEPLLNSYRMGCASCQARAIAVTGDRVLLIKDPLDPQWQEILERAFGPAWSEHLPVVRHWLGVIRRHEAAVP